MNIKILKHKKRIPVPVVVFADYIQVHLKKNKINVCTCNEVIMYKSVILCDK